MAEGPFKMGGVYSNFALEIHILQFILKIFENTMRITAKFYSNHVWFTNLNFMQQSYLILMITISHIYTTRIDNALIVTQNICNDASQGYEGCSFTQYQKILVLLFQWAKTKRFLLNTNKN
jgi:hypothetical protein